MAEPTGLLRRIARTLGGEDIIDALVRMPPRDLKSLLLHVFERRAEHLTPLDLLTQYESTPAFAPSFAEPRVSTTFQHAAFAAADLFEAIELSQLCPLGTMHVLAGIHQNNVLSASRGGEVVADPTPVIALECARRRRHPQDRARPLRLCTSRRVMRMQPVPVPGLLPHFSLFAMATAGQKAPAFETEELRQHLEVYLRLFQSLGSQGFRLADVAVDVSDTEAVEQRLTSAGVDLQEVRRSVRTHHFADPDELIRQRGLAPLRGPVEDVLPALGAFPAHLAERLRELQVRVLDPLAATFPRVRVRLDLSRLEGLGYYVGSCVRISARAPSGDVFPLVDGGFTRWTQELLSDRSERFLITGIGSDLVCARFR
jgi:hypothetical protein